MGTIFSILSWFVAWECECAVWSNILRIIERYVINTSALFLYLRSQFYCATSYTSLRLSMHDHNLISNDGLNLVSMIPNVVSLIYEVCSWYSFDSNPISRTRISHYPLEGMLWQIAYSHDFLRVVGESKSCLVREVVSAAKNKVLVVVLCKAFYC